MVDPTTSSATPIRTLSPAPDPSSGQKPAAKPTTPRPPRRSANFSTAPFWTGSALSIAWIGVVIFAMINSSGLESFAGLSLTSWAIGISAIVSPVAMIWMVAAYLQRAADVQSVTEPLRRQLAMITGESGAAEIRVRRFNQAVKEQIELLRSTKHVGDKELLAIIERINAHKIDLEQFEKQSLYQVKEIQDIISRSMQHVEKLMDDKFSMLRVLDNKLVQSGDSVARQTDGMREQIAKLLEDVETHSLTIASSVEKAMKDSKKLSDTTRAQESSLIAAAQTASSTLQELSGRIDTDIAHFLGRTGMAREEAERLATAFDAQTRSLEELSTMVPSRITEAEAVLRGVADRLYASEQLAREQATNLSERLSERTESLEAFLERFTSRVTAVDGTLRQRQTDLDGLVVRVSGASNDLSHQLESCLETLGERAEDALRRFALANEEARRGTDTVAARIAETAGRYEEATSRLDSVSTANAARIKETTAEISAQMAQFESLQKASQQAGAEVQKKAEQAISNLQQVLERLLSTRDATQNVSDLLTEKLTRASVSNEQIITRINETSRASVHALEAAAEALSRQESGLAHQAQDAESILRATVAQLEQQAQDSGKALRHQGDSLTVLLDEVKSRLDATDKRLQDFADLATAPIQQVVDKIEESAAKGRVATAQYGTDIQAQLDHLLQFNGRIGAMGTEVGKMTAETLAAIEDMNRRFESVRAAQTEATQAALAQFDAVAQRLQREVGSLGSESEKATAMLKTMTEQVGLECRALQTESEGSGAKITAVTGVLQSEAKTIRKMLEDQAAEINVQLSSAGSKFEELGRTLREKTDTAYALLDRVATRYNEITGDATAAFEDKAANINTKASEATEKVTALTDAIQANLGMIDQGAARVQSGAGVIAISSDKTIDRLEQLNARLSALQDTTLDGTTRVVEKIEDAAQNFQRSSEGITASADEAIGLVRKAGTVFGEQASHLLDVSHQVEGSVRSLSEATASFASQSSDVRTTMEQHNARLVSQLRDSISQLDNVSAHLQETAATAVVSADNAATRYDELAARASTRLDDTSRTILRIADDTDTALSALSASVTQQVAALNITSEQIAGQHKALMQASEDQKLQLLNLFERLGDAHNEASIVAERTIQRLDETLGKVQEHLGKVSDRSQATLADVTLTGDGFAMQSEKLIAHARQAEEQARSAMTVTGSLQDQAAKLHTALREEMDRAGGLLSDLLGRLSSGGETMRDVAATSSMALNDLRESIASRTSALSDSMEQIAARQETLTRALDTQRQTLDGLLARLSSAQDETAVVADRTAARLSDGAGRIQAHIETMNDKAASTLETLQTANEAFIKESDALSRHAQEAQAQTLSLLDVTVQASQKASESCQTIKTQTQETEQVVATAVDKMDGKASQLRNAGQATEAALDTLASTIKQQTSALDDTLGRVSERQESLCAALEVQRDTLGGVVTRLTLAQDETAAVAERASSRLNDSTAQIVRQMDTLDERAQNALAAVRAAGTGVAEETARLAAETEKAQGSLRGTIETTQDLHEKTVQMRQAMDEEAEKTIAQVRTVISHFEATVDTIRSQGERAQGAIDTSTLGLATMGQNASEAIQKSADHLASVTQKAQGDMDALDSKIRQSAKLVEEAGTVSVDQGIKLSETAEQATTKLVGFISQMVESDATTRAILETAEKRLTGTRVTLETELQNIAELSGRAVEQVMGAGSALAIQSDALRANLAGSESALATAAETLRAEVSQMPNLLGRSVKDIEAAAKAFKTQTTDISGCMLQATDRCIGATGAIRDTMTEEAQALASTAEEAGKTLARFNEALLAQITALHTSSGTLSDEQKTMVENASRSVEQLTQAENRLAQIQGDALATTTKLAAAFDGIEERTAETARRLAGAGESLGAQVNQLILATEKAEGQMGRASKGFREQLESVRSGVQSQIEDINRGLMQITAQLDRTGTSLRAAMAGTVTDVEKIAGRLDQTSKDTAAQLTDRTARMRVATEEVNKLMNGFGTQIDALLERLNTAGTGIKRHEGDLVGHMQQAFTHLGAVAERLDSTRVLAANVSEAALSKLGEVSQDIEKQMRAMADSGQKVSTIIQTVGQTYVDQAAKVNNGFLSSQDQILAMNKAIEDMQLRADRMRVALKLQGDDLLDSLEQILTKLTQAGGAMETAVDGSLQTFAAQSLKKIGS